MKTIIWALLLILLSNVCLGQEKIEVVYNNDFSVELNGVRISNETTYDEVVEIFGEPQVYREYPTGKTNYRYTDLGLVFHTVDGKLLTLAFNYNWDGDENFPDRTFEGVLQLGESIIDQETTKSVIEKLDDLEIKCIIPRMCMNNPKEVKNPIVLGFKDDLITQVSIEFH